MTDENRSKMAKKSRRKGKRGEYEVRDALQDFYYPDGKGTVQRTPMSGAWHGTEKMSGDLIFTKNGTTDETVPIFWEVKLYQKGTFKLGKFLGGSFGNLVGWWNTANEKSGDLFPIILWREDGMPWCVFMHNDLFEQFQKLSSGRTPEVVLHATDFVIIELQFFLAWIGRDAFGKLVRLPRYDRTATA